MVWLFAVCFGLVMVLSIKGFVVHRKNKTDSFADTRFSVELFGTLLIIYVIVMLGFSGIYFLLSLEGVVLVEHNELRQVSVMESLSNSVYFSGVTLLTIGYGDITPVGIGRLIAVSQALIGYILPAAFVLKIVQSQRGID